MQKNGGGHLKNTLVLLLCLYLFLTLCGTVIFRETSASTRYILLPFWCYTSLYNRLLNEIILNILFFIPIGFLATGAITKPNLLKVCGMGCGWSITIELLQLITRRGVCNINDVIHNTIGCIIGYGIYRGCIFMIKKIQQMLQR